MQSIQSHSCLWSSFKTARLAWLCCAVLCCAVLLITNYYCRQLITTTDESCTTLCELLISLSLIHPLRALLRLRPILLPQPCPTTPAVRSLAGLARSWPRNQPGPTNQARLRAKSRLSDSIPISLSPFLRFPLHLERSFSPRPFDSRSQSRHLPPSLPQHSLQLEISYFRNSLPHSFGTANLIRLPLRENNQQASHRLSSPQNPTKLTIPPLGSVNSSIVFGRLLMYVFPRVCILRFVQSCCLQFEFTFAMVNGRNVAVGSSNDLHASSNNQTTNHFSP